jgi:hypothetical protein
MALRVALDHAERLRWSNYHTWSFYGNKSEEEMRASLPNPWDEMYSFGTCLGVASSIATPFKQVLLQDEDLAHYAGDVQVVADSSVAAIKKSPRYHCLTMLRFRESVIVIDLSAQYPAFKIDLETI